MKKKYGRKNPFHSYIRIWDFYYSLITFNFQHSTNYTYVFNKNFKQLRTECIERLRKSLRSTRKFSRDVQIGLARRKHILTHHTSRMDLPGEFSTVTSLPWVLLSPGYQLPGDRDKIQHVRSITCFVRVTRTSPTRGNLSQTERVSANRD